MRTDERTSFDRECALIEELSDYVTRAKAAGSAETLGSIYRQAVGYNPLTECPNMPADDIRADLFDYVREVCYSSGIGCGLVGLFDA